MARRAWERRRAKCAGVGLRGHWPDVGLTIELHGYRFHASRRAFEADVIRKRRTRHVAFSWGGVFERPAATATEVRTLLSGQGRNFAA